MDAPDAFLVDFSEPDPPRFQPLDDRVMGGRSVSRLRRTPQGTGVFEGMVSLANGGGFASVRGSLDQRDLSAAKGVLLRVRGDGRRYRLVLRNDRRLSGLNHMQEFQAPDGEWGEVVLLWDGFRASRQGYTPPEAPPLDPSRIRQAGFMIADRQDGPFRLEVAWVRGWDGSPPAPGGTGS